MYRLSLDLPSILGWKVGRVDRTTAAYVTCFLVMLVRLLLNQQREKQYEMQAKAERRPSPLTP